MSVVERSSQAKAVVINLRAQHSQRELIDRAASVLGTSRSDFMIESALRAAENVLLDQVFFNLDEATYQQFTEALENPPAIKKRLLAMLTDKAPWE